MAESSEKVPIASAGPEELQHFMPPAYSSVAVKPSATSRLLKAGLAVLVAGALLLLLGAAGAFYFWNNNEKHVYNVHYSMSINGKVEEGSMEIDTANNMERFSTGSGEDEAVEVHDFEIGITGIRFSGGEKCYIKTQVKARLPDEDTLNKESMTFDLEDEVMPAKFEDDLIWVAAGAPLSDSTFLSSKIKDLCGDLPIFWLRPTYSTSGKRKRRAAPHQRRQAAGQEGGGTRMRTQRSTRRTPIREDWRASGAPWTSTPCWTTSACAATSAAAATPTARGSASRWAGTTHGRTTTEAAGWPAGSSCPASGGWPASWAWCEPPGLT
uniref:Leukocyte cell-derived chemotaxin 1 n=1 Tax=Kryptolebias marmoratus TaxID=37003 RepID=A0A3Q3A5R9_KRYMA